MVEAHRAVGGTGGAKVLQVGAGAVIQLLPQPPVQAPDIGHLLQHLHAHGGAQELGVGQLGGPHLHDPVRPAAIVSEQAKLRHKPGDGAHKLDDTRVAVAPGPQHAVGINHGGGLRPREDLPPLGHISRLRQIAGAGVCVFVHEAQAPQLVLVVLLLAVHKFEYDILQKRRGNVPIQRPGIRGEGLLAHCPRRQQLIIEVVYRLHHTDAEADNGMPVFSGDRHHPLCAKGLPVHDQGLDHFGHGLPPLAVQQRLLLLCQYHRLFSFSGGPPPDFTSWLDGLCHQYTTSPVGIQRKSQSFPPLPLRPHALRVPKSKS